MAAHGADAHAKALDRNRVRAAPEDLVGLGAPLPLLAALTVAEILVDPRDQAAREGRAELRLRQVGRPQRIGHGTVDVEDCAGRIVEQRRHRGMHAPHLLHELAHVLRTRAGGRLVGHRGHPLDEVCAEQAPERHHHQRHGAVATDIVTDAIAQARVDDASIDGIEDDDRVVLHAQRRGRVDPEAGPARGAQPGMDRVRVVAALAGHDDVALRERGDVVRIREDTGAAPQVRRRRADLRRTEEHRVHVLEVTFDCHALHEDRSHHAPPTDDARPQHAASTPPQITTSRAGSRRLYHELIAWP